MRKVLVTGANGFVGKVVCDSLADAGCFVRAAVRSAAAQTAVPQRPEIETFVQGGLLSTADWGAALESVEVVVHLAARVHVMSESAADPELAFRAVNLEGTVALANQARDAGASRFIFMSSIKVNGERTGSQPFSASDEPTPEDAYARSKRDAEVELLALARPGFEVVIIRPPLVYGPGVKANFLLLMKLAARGLPLPLGSVRNARSLVNVWNLADFVRHVALQQSAAGGVWLVSDGQDLSTPQLVARLAASLGRKPRVFRMPVVILRAAAALLGKAGEMRRLTESLQIDSGPARALLHWEPKVSVDEGLARTAHAWLADSARPGGTRGR